MASAYGFAFAQAVSVQVAAERYPQLRPDLELAQARFEHRFRRSVEMIDSILWGLGPEWSQQRPIVEARIVARARAHRVAVAEAEEFVRTIKARVAGEEDVPYVQTLLTYHPQYLASPAAEFVDGYRRLFISDGSGKSKGVRFRLYMPLSWSARDGDRPNIVQTFTSEAGRGLETFIVQVRDLDLPAGTVVTRQDLEEFAADPLLGRTLTAGTRYTELCSERTTIDGLPARTVYMRGTTAGPAAALDHIAVAYVTIVEDKLFLMQGMVGSPVGAGEDLLGRWQRYLPVFQLMASGLVIESRWE